MKERLSENRYDIQGFATFDHGDHYFRMDGEAPRSEYWWFFVTYILATIATGVLAAVVAVAADVDVLLVAHWGAWTLLVVFFCQWFPCGFVGVVP